MKYLVISAAHRPHITDGPCWCPQKLVKCDCGEDHGSVMLHKDPTLTEDHQERMSVYSEQRAFEPG